MIRVGFIIGHEAGQWSGGISYYSNLIGALYALPDRAIEPAILIGEDAEVPPVIGRLPAPVIRSAVLDRSGAVPFMRRADRRLFSHDRLLERFLIAHDIAVLSHSGFIGTRSRVPTLGWIPDFQHLHYPEFFSPAEIAVRDNAFASLCRFCDGVLVSSESAMKALCEHYPAAKAKARVLRFVAGLDETEKGAEAARIVSRAGEPFFYLPNQFWIHKNHRVVIEALRFLKKTGRPVRVVATGQTLDYRRPGFFDELMASVSAAGVSDELRILGQVERAEVGRLMRHAVAVINPSLYEGWSTTVEEAKSMGKQTILSDIPVHREQAPPDGIYFDPHKPAELAEILWRVWSEFDPGSDQRRMQRAWSEWPRRREEFARRYEELVMELRDDSRRTSRG